MGYISIAVLLTIITILGLFGKKIKWKECGKVLSLGLAGRIVSGVSLGLLLIITGFSSINSVPAGYIGLVKTFGNYTGQQSPGLNFKYPWQQVDEVNGRVQKAVVTMNGGKGGSAVSKETQPVYAVLTINYQIELKEARELYSNVGEDYYKAVIEPRIQQAFKSITVEYSTEDVAPNREEIRKKARTILTEQLGEYGITINDLLIKNLDFSPEFSNAIEDKQVATQEALAAKERVAKSRAEASQVIATARGKAEATRIEGNALRLNPQIVQMRAIEMLNPNVQVLMVPSNSNMILPGSLLQSGK